MESRVNKGFGFFCIALVALVAACDKKSDELQPLDQLGLLPLAKRITIKITDYCPTAGRRFSEFFASNFSVEVQADKLYIDTDADGIPNVKDTSDDLYLSPYSRDTNGDGYSDLLMYVMGIPKDAQPWLKVCQSGNLDTDHDGLNDCEEGLLRTNPQNPDTDGDGIPDYLELRAGLNPSDPSDSGRDPDGDGFTNLQEVKMNTPALQFNTPDMTRVAYGYDIVTKPTGDTNCYDITISNVPLVIVPKGNLMAFYFMEQEKASDATKTAQLFSVSRHQTISKDTAGGAVLTYSFNDLTDLGN